MDLTRQTPIVAMTGWQTLGGLVAIREDADLDLAELKKLLHPRGDDDPRPTQPRSPRHERLRDRRRDVTSNRSPTTPCARPGRSERSRWTWGDTACKVPLATELHRKGKEARLDRQEA
jgi:hypothetical protein